MPKGQTFIFDTALLSSDSGFYIRTSQSHSRHTVVAAEQDQVREVGQAALGPVTDVMALAMPRRTVTAGERTPAVAEEQRPAQPG